MESNPVGRPTGYTLEKAKEVCELTATSSKSLKTICKELDLKVRTVLDWLSENKGDNEFSQMYAMAKQEQADFLAEEILEISEHTEEDHTAFTGANVVNRDRLRIDARKWIASKLKPKKYGDKVDLNHGGSIEIKQITGMEVK